MNLSNMTSRTVSADHSLTSGTKAGPTVITGYKMDDFDEQERRLLAEALHDSEQQLAMAKLELSRCQAEKEGLQRLLTKERRRHKVVQDELDSVKLRSHHMLLCQGDELAQSVISLSQLAGGLGKLYAELQKAADRFSEPAKSVDEEHKTSSDVSHSSSGVSDTSGDSGIDASPVNVTDDVIVDKHVKTSEVKGERDVTQDGCSGGGGTGGDSDGTGGGGSRDVAVRGEIRPDNANNSSSVGGETNPGSRRQPPQFGSSVGSAFDPIHSRKRQVAPPDVTDTEQNSLDLSSLDELPVNKQVDELCKVVTLIISALGQVKSGVTASHAKKQARLRSLESSLNEAHSDHQRELAVLRASVDGSAEAQHQMALKLRLLEAELESTHEQLSSQEESLMGLRELLQQRTLKLEQLHDQFTYIQRLKQEVDHMTRLSQQKDSENAIIAETLESTLARLKETSGAAGDTEVNYIRENLGLKKEVSYLKQRLVQTQEDVTTVTDKANKRMRTLETNWRQAESELHRLDQLLEHILQVLRNHVAVVKEWDDASLILREITDANTSSDSVD